MINQYNRQQNRIYRLNQRGYHQAQRNDSHQIWTLLSWEEELQSSNNKEQQETFDNTLNQQLKIPIKNENPTQENKRSVSFKVSRNEQAQNRSQEKQFNNTERPAIRQNSFVKSRPIKRQQKTGNKRKEEKVQTELQKLKRKSIQKYLKSQVPYSRTLSNSAFRKFYQRPCPEAYGNKNTSTQRGAFYGNFMKTHNIQPHTLNNFPQTYQTYISALNFGKRTKLDLEDRWKRMERQLSKNLDYRQLAKMKAVGQIQVNEAQKGQILKQNINSYGAHEGQVFTQANNLTKTVRSLGKMQTRATFKTTEQKIERSESEEKKRSRSSEKPLYFIYKYKQTENGYDYTRYARDRHGITCYVDNCFRQNDEAFTTFMKKLKPIFPQKCKPEDMNIDKIRIENCEKNKVQQLPRHYLMPNVQIPYVAGNYTRKKAQSMVQIPS